VAIDPANRVQLAVSHWKPRFVANGIDVNDFERVQAATLEWADWAPNWKAVGDMHRALAEQADAEGHVVSATEAFQRAAWSYHLGKFLWFEDPDLHREMNALVLATYSRALPHLDPPGERLDIPFEGTTLPGNLRRPRGVARPPVVLLVPGLDSVKEELFAMEQDFLRRGMATLTLDGPGQGESAPRFPIRADWSSVVRPVIDALEARSDVDAGRVGLMGISMGGIYGPLAATKEKRIRALVALAGPYDLSACWPALNELTRAGYVFYTKSRDEDEAFEKTKSLSLHGVLAQVDQPMLVIHGARDRLFPPEQAERIVREAPDATLLMYPDGNHVCNNITYKYRPAMTDWMSERLSR
jgi:dipeptidyl aminopeptidase/acylaminoacyl peptidase